MTDGFLTMVGLTAFAERYPHQLSGGMKQRVAIARVLANDTDILLMDEPFGALDALTRSKLQEELIDIWQSTKLTVIFVTHSVEEAVLLADRVAVMTRRARARGVRDQDRSAPPARCVLAGIQRAAARRHPQADEPHLQRADRRNSCGFLT